MNDSHQNEHREHLQEPSEHVERPPTERAVPEPVDDEKMRDAVETPDAIEAEKIARRSGSRPLGLNAPARGLEWLRPTDLLARHSARVAGNGIDFQSATAYRARQAALRRARSLADRAKRLPPLSAFGRSSSPRPSSRSAIGSA